jgi:hypothetical protein
MLQNLPGEDAGLPVNSKTILRHAKGHSGLVRALDPM